MSDEEKEVQSEINEMVDALADGVEEELGVDDEPEIEEDEEEEGGEEEGGEEEAEDDAGEDEEEEDPTAELRERLAALQDQLSAMQAAQQEAAKEPVKETPPEVIDFLEGKSLEDVASDEGEFNSMLNSIYRRALKDAQEGVLRSIPDVIQNVVTQQTTMTQKVNEFYKSNPDLAEFRGAVSSVAQEVAGAHPEWSVDKVFTETEKESRRRLNLKKKAAGKAKVKPRGFAKGGASKRGAKAPSLSDLEAEIAAMNDQLPKF